MYKFPTAMIGDMPSMRLKSASSAVKMKLAKSWERRHIAIPTNGDFPAGPALEVFLSSTLDNATKSMPSTTHPTPTKWCANILFFRTKTEMMQT